MTSDADILVSCTNGACSIRKRTPLLDLQTLILLYEDEVIPGFDELEANKRLVPCPACVRAGRSGELLYMPDHLRKAPPDQEVAVPAVYDALTSVWKYASEILSVTRRAGEHTPDKLTVPTGVRLEVRPYGGHVLRHGNTDQGPQYGEGPAGQAGAAKNPQYIRELKHDLLYLAYYGNRERTFARELGGVGVFETMTVGAILALKFDLSFFYGVPTTKDLDGSMVSDAELRGLTLDTFSKPIFFDPKMQDNPLRPLVKGLIYPLGKALRSFSPAHEKLGAALALLEQANASGLKPAQARKLRAKATKDLGRAVKRLPKTAPALDAASLKALPGVRKERALDAVLQHPVFATSKRKSWSYFETCLRESYTLDSLRVSSHVGALEELAADEDKKLAKAASRALERYKPLADALRAADAGEVRKLLGGLPDTFEPYRAELHKYAVVDHATAFYIKAILAGIKIGSNAGKVTAQPGRKLVYRMPEGGLKGEPETRKRYAEMVIEACQRNSRFTVPPMIMLERQKNESGFRATDRVGDLALTKEESRALLPIVGIDWRNWGYLDDGEKASNFAFSEMFTNSVGVKQEHPGYKGPIVLSRGVGGGQVTLGTRLEGVSPKGVEKEGYDYQWICGIPVPEGDPMPTPGHWTGAKGSIELARDVLVKKYIDASKNKDCTFGKVAGGKKFDCAACLARFNLDDKPDLRLCTQGKDRSYYCAVDASRWEELFGQKLAEDTEAARTEFPCSWLRAVQKYAGASARGYERILKASREIVAVGKSLDAGDDLGDELDEIEATGAEDEDEDGDGGSAGEPDDEDADTDEPPRKEASKKKQKPKKKTPARRDPKKKDPPKKDEDSPKAALRAAFEQVREKL